MKKPTFRQYLFIAGVFLLGGCATTQGDIDLSNPTTGDLLFRNKDILSQIEQQRLIVSGMKSDISQLEGRLDTQKENLVVARRLMEQAVAKSKLTAQEKEIYQSRLKALENRRSQNNAQLKSMQAELHQIDSQKVNLDNLSTSQKFERIKKRTAIENRISAVQDETAIMKAQTDDLSNDLLRISTDITPFS